VGQHAGDDSALVRISPYLYGQRKLLNIFFLPKLRDLPQHGLDLKALVFDFGFNANNLSLDPFNTTRANETCRRNFLVWGITGRADLATLPPTAPPEPSYLFQFFHAHEGVQRQFYNKDLSNRELAGNAQHPHLLPHPYLILAGDTITCEVQNLGSSALDAQVVLLGGEFD
jgi:hypothetical protein